VIFKCPAWRLATLVGLITVLLICTLIAALKVKVFISDDVIYQVMARQISDRQLPMYFPSDNFFLKTWIYFFAGGSSRLAIDVIAIGFAFRVRSIHSFLPKVLGGSA
jgi:hypothetical protein